MSEALERIEREMGIAGLAARLGEMAPTDLQTLLLEVYRSKSQRRTPAAVLADYESNRFARPSGVHLTRLLAWEQTAFAALPDEFEAVELSPVCPLGTSSAVGLVDQNRVVSTSRNTEVVSDSTNVLALECAARRREMLRGNPKAPDAVHLAASHRLLRAQRYEANPHLVPHFRAFALCSAGRDAGNLRFELATMALHAGVYLRALKAFAGEGVGLRLAVTDFAGDGRRDVIDGGIFAAIQREFAGVSCEFDAGRTGGKDYYADLCFHIYARTPAGDWLEVGDGGVVDWTQKLLSSKKERCVISGVGSERICTVW
jgi:hypothetical protein